MYEAVLRLNDQLVAVVITDSNSCNLEQNEISMIKMTWIKKSKLF